MELILAGINKVYLTSIALQNINECSEVIAIVPYCNSLGLFQIAHEAQKKLTFYGRLDETVPVPSKILSWFTYLNSTNYLCYLYRGGLHAKVIWFKGVGVYIGSANLTDNGWIRNIEAGVFIEEDSAGDESIFENLELLLDAVVEGRIAVDNDLVDLVKKLEAKRQPVDKEQGTVKRWFDSAFKKFPKQPYLTDYQPRVTDKRAEFLKEWRLTHTLLKSIQDKLEPYKPDWITGDIAKGVHLDQFLHAVHYKRVGKGNTNRRFEENKRDPEAALKREMIWWKSGDYDRTNEEISINEWAPRVSKLLHKDKILTLTEAEFIELCSMTHATREYSLRGKNSLLGLNSDVQTHNVKIKALGRVLYSSKSKGGNSTLNTIHYVLYGGDPSDVPERLFNAIHSSEWKVKNLGIRSLGEIVGWAMPDIYPPRNGRTVKALQALGNDIGRKHTEDLE